MDVGEQLPWVGPLADDRGRPLDWRDTRRNRVVFFTHATGCASCSDYARELLALCDDLARWDGDLWLAGGTAADVAPLPGVVRGVTGDADRRLRQRCGRSSEDAWLIVADRWGQIWHSATADDRHALVDVSDVLETITFIAMQCPECETLDQPVGDWSDVR